MLPKKNFEKPSLDTYHIRYKSFCIQVVTTHFFINKKLLHQYGCEFKVKGFLSEESKMQKKPTSVMPPKRRRKIKEKEGKYEDTYSPSGC